MKKYFFIAVFFSCVLLSFVSCDFETSIATVDRYIFSSIGKPIFLSADLVDIQELSFDPSIYKDKDIIVRGRVNNLETNHVYMSIFDKEMSFLVSLVYLHEGLFNFFNGALNDRYCHVLGKINDNKQGIQYIEAKSLYCQ